MPPKSGTKRKSEAITITHKTKRPKGDDHVHITTKQRNYVLCLTPPPTTEWKDTDGGPLMCIGREAIETEEHGFQATDCKIWQKLTGWTNSLKVEDEEGKLVSFPTKRHTAFYAHAHLDKVGHVQNNDDRSTFSAAIAMAIREKSDGHALSFEEYGRGQITKAEYIKRLDAYKAAKQAATAQQQIVNQATGRKRKPKAAPGDLGDDDAVPVQEQREIGGDERSLETELQEITQKIGGMWVKPRKDSRETHPFWVYWTYIHIRSPESTNWKCLVSAFHELFGARPDLRMLEEAKTWANRTTHGNPLKCPLLAQWWLWARPGLKNDWHVQLPKEKAVILQLRKQDFSRFVKEPIDRFLTPVPPQHELKKKLPTHISLFGVLVKLPSSGYLQRKLHESSQGKMRWAMTADAPKNILGTKADNEDEDVEMLDAGGEGAEETVASAVPPRAGFITPSPSKTATTGPPRRPIKNPAAGNNKYKNIHKSLKGLQRKQ